VKNVGEVFILISPWRAFAGRPSAPRPHSPRGASSFPDSAGLSYPRRIFIGAMYSSRHSLLFDAAREVSICNIRARHLSARSIPIQLLCSTAAAAAEGPPSG